MLRLRVVQAEFGDCLILEYGRVSQPGYILIDGGPAGTYPKHLRFELDAIQQRGGCLDMVVLSHVDNDHIIGLLEMMSDRVNQRSNGAPEGIPIRALWHNAFSQAEGAGTNFSVGPGVQFSPTFMAASNETVFGISEGNQLMEASKELAIPLNPGFPGQLITLDDAPKPIRLDGLNLHVVGPTVRNLERLKKDWLAWLKKVQERAPFADPVEADKLDRSIPNLSSIMLLAVSGRRKILLTGDGLGSDLLEGLAQSHLLDAQGKLHVSIFKLPHHGSVRNMNRALFDVITADTYVVSANGKYDNPDLATLIWLVEAVKKQNRKVRLVATNQTESTSQLVQEYPPASYGYRLDILNPKEHSILL